MQSPALTLEELLQIQNEILVLPGIYDGVTAKIVEFCQFKCAYMSGYCSSATYGFPDFGLLSMHEMLESLRKITNSIDIPIIADADTGYGNEINMYRTFKEYEKAGASGVQIEDQSWPKRCGHMEGKQVIDAAEMVDKIKASLDARNNSSTKLIVRTDSLTEHGIEEAIRRSEMYTEAGADIIFVENPTTMRELEEIPTRIKLPCMCNMALPTFDLTTNDLRDIGYSLAIYPISLIIGMFKASMNACNSLKYNGKPPGLDSLASDFHKLNTILGINKFQQLEEKYASLKKANTNTR